MTTRVNKGNSIVIQPTHQYETKIQNFILNYNSRTTTRDPTNIFQTHIRQTINETRTLTPRDSRWNYIKMNTSGPSIKGLIKLYKPDQQIRPVVNWKNDPAYRLSKLFTEKIHHLTPLPNAFNIKNIQELIQNLNDTPLLPCHSLTSLDIMNMYSNIPIVETKKILTDILKLELVNPQAQQEILKWYDIITRQN